MSLLLTVLVLMLAAQCWSAPQRRNWTPQAMLYLKGAQGHRSALERTSRGDGRTLHLATRGRSSDAPRSSPVSSVLLELLQRAVEEGGGNLENYPDEELNLNYL